jgi:hypothetical protein
MNRMLTNLLVLALVVLAVPALAVSPDVRISQVYGGGGSASGFYTKDYVELFNASGAAVDIGNWVIEYGSATGNWGSTAGNYFVIPADTFIPACSYFLVALGAVGTGGATLPYYDLTSTNCSMSGTSGKVGLFNALNSNVACGSETAGTLVDKVAYGTANCAEGTAVGALSTATAAIRNGGGMIDTDSNLSDFTVDAPAPSWSGSPRNGDCLAVGNEDQSWSSIKAFYR